MVKSQKSWNNLFLTKQGNREQAFWESFIFACSLVLYLYACAVENPESPGFCVSKSRGLRTGHKGVKHRNVVLFCYVDKGLNGFKLHYIPNLFQWSKKNVTYWTSVK